LLRQMVAAVALEVVAVMAARNFVDSPIKLS
jgi:hypothetical protein